MAISTTVMDFRTKATFRTLDDRPGDGFVPIKQGTGLGPAMRWIGRVMQRRTPGSITAHPRQHGSNMPEMCGPSSTTRMERPYV